MLLYNPRVVASGSASKSSEFILAYHHEISIFRDWLLFSGPQIRLYLLLINLFKRILLSISDTILHYFGLLSLVSTCLHVIKYGTLKSILYTRDPEISTQCPLYRFRMDSRIVMFRIPMRWWAFLEINPVNILLYKSLSWNYFFRWTPEIYVSSILSISNKRW